MTPLEHFLIDIIQILLRGWIENTITEIGHCKAATDIFRPTLRNFFYKRWPILFFSGRGFYFVWCCRKNFNVCRLGFFVWAQRKLWFGRHRHVFICLARKTLANSAKKHDSPIRIEKNVSRRRPGNMSDQGLKKKHHRMTPIKHFLLDIIQIIFRDWIEDTIADISGCKSATDIFHPTLRNFFYKRWPILFFNGRGFYFFRCCRKNFKVFPLGFFVLAQPKLWFRRDRHVFFCLSRITLANSAKKHDSPIRIEKNVSRHRPGNMSDQGLKKKRHPMTPIEHILIDIIQILFTDWIEDTIVDIGGCKAATDIFLPTLRNFFYKRWPILFLNDRGF